MKGARNLSEREKLKARNLKGWNFNGNKVVIILVGLSVSQSVSLSISL